MINSILTATVEMILSRKLEEGGTGEKIINIVTAAISILIFIVIFVLSAAIIAIFKTLFD